MSPTTDRRRKKDPDGPKPYTWRSLSTLTVKVPQVDWPAVVNGTKTEFRSSGTGRPPNRLLELPFPLPVWCYSLNHAKVWQGKLMVLEGVRRERLMAIEQESLEREGFKTMDEFKRYWLLRTGKRIRPLTEVTVYRVRPIETAADMARMGASIVHYLYDPLPAEVRREEG